ncbi:MAG: pseudouridine synthase [Candidatus Paceibacterota bacterium]
MRIQKYCSEKGLCSRREAEDYIKRGYIKVNGMVVREMGIQIDSEKDKIELIIPRKITETQGKITLLCYKPRGYTCTKSRDEGPSIFVLFPEFMQLNTVGRLDKESEGLILLSNDGRVTKAVTGEERKIEKEYEVDVREDVSQDKLKLLSRGVLIDGIQTLPAITKLVGPHRFRIVLREGKKHQVRRMADVVQWTVTKLKRIRIGSLTGRGLEPGKGRQLSGKEISEIVKI